MPEFSIVQLQHGITQRGLGQRAEMTSLADLPPRRQNHRPEPQMHASEEDESGEV